MTIELNRRWVLGGLAALPACRTSDKKFDAEIIVLGAGLSGLHAARLLSEEGKDVLVLEGSSQIGGRLHTLDHGALGYTEGGGEQIGSTYARIIDTADQLGVALEPENTLPRATTYYYKDTLYTPDEWKNLDTHPFPTPFKGSSPASPLFALAAKSNPLNSANAWRDPAFKAFDISAADFLAQNGFDDEARRVINVALNANNLNSYSMMNLYRSLQLYAQARDSGPSLSVIGGAQRLPEAMAKSLPRSVKTGQFITGITAHDEAVTVTTASGKTYRASHVIAALPFGVLRNIELNIPLGDMQDYAIKHLPYTQIYQVHFQAEAPFWEQDGLPADMWTDSQIERVFASRDKQGVPNGIFRAWINGTTASIWAKKEDAKAQFLSMFERIRPASKGQIKILALQNWTKANPLSGGAYMHWSPGQIPLMSETMANPAGRVHFAGEHLSHLYTGMEGAMESAENAVFRLLDI